MQITDNNNCQRLDSFFVHEPAALSSQILATHVSCPGGFDGNLDLTVMGGTTPYTYSWSNGSSAQDNSNMVPGNYSVTIADANGCVHTDSTSVSEPAELDISISATPDTIGYGDGTATVSTIGGTSPYSYEWSLSLIHI